MVRLPRIRGAGAVWASAFALAPALPPAAPAPPAAPRLTALTVTPRSFAPAASGGAVSGSSNGTVVGYTVSEPGTVIFAVWRADTGRLSAGRCLRTTRKVPRGQRCRMYDRLGYFSDAALSGRNSVRFSGRLRGRALRPGTYLLSASAENAAGAWSDPPVDAGFVVTGARSQ